MHYQKSVVPGSVMIMFEIDVKLSIMMKGIHKNLVACYVYLFFKI